MRSRTCGDGGGGGPAYTAVGSNELVNVVSLLIRTEPIMLYLHLFPVVPSMQKHRYASTGKESLAIESMHVPPYRQGVLAHSSMSTSQLCPP